MSENAKLERLKQICVVVDTNTFVHSTLLLGTPLGMALLFSLGVNGRLGMPEVLEQEIVKRAVSHARDMADKISRNLESLKTITGKELILPLPTNHELKKYVEDRLRELSDKFVRVPFTLDHAKSSLQRVMEESPPNGEKDQQFKDSAIWESVLELAKSYEVHFITKDKGFYYQRDPKKGLVRWSRFDGHGILFNNRQIKDEKSYHDHHARCQDPAQIR
ncbi:MAG: PIN domain-containing protein [Acidobacteriota bacterium]|nr:PIN domain-containing protein [Acidobacteriota bacterium]